MQLALDLFHANIQRSRDLADLFRALAAQTTVALDLSDILRASLVMSVSALDHFIHEIVRLGMLEAYRGERDRTPAFLRFQVSLEGVIAAPAGDAFEDWLDSRIRARHGHQSFQFPERIAEAIRLISDLQLWNEVSREIGMERRQVMDQLSLIVQRRNKIAHEADVMPDYSGQLVDSGLRSPIDETAVDNAVNFIQRVAEEIYSLVSLPNSALPTGSGH